MALPEVVALLRDTRRDEDVVISSMGSAREWMAQGPLHERDFVLVPSAMGHATSVGLGLALAQPERRVIVLSGDGSLMMNLGTLITMGAQAPANLIVFVLVNGVYEVTGAQPTPASAGTENRVEIATIVRGCGIQSMYHWSRIDDMRAGLADALNAQGPTVIVLDVMPVPDARGPRSPGPTNERALRFREAIRRS